MGLKLISLFLLITPLLHFLFLCYLKDKYHTKVIKIILYIVFGVSLVLLALKVENALSLTICSLIASFLSDGVERIYVLILNAVLTPIIESLSDAKVLSLIYVTKNSAYAITSKGYIVIQYKEQEYVLYKCINEAPTIDQGIFTKLNGSIKTSDNLQ